MTDMADGESTATTGESQSASTESVSVPAYIASLRDLVDHLDTISRKLERSWSAALDQGLDSEQARQEVLGGWRTLVVYVQNVIDAASQHVRDLGHDTNVAFSTRLNDEDLHRWLTTADTVERFKRLYIALTYAIFSLDNAMGGLVGHTVHTFSESIGRQTWWEAGAFNMLRARGRLVVRICDAIDIHANQLAQSVTDADVRHSTSRSIAHQYIDELQTVRRLVSVGLPESALAHLPVCIKSMIATWGDVSLDEVPDDVPEFLSRVQPLKGLAEPIGLAKQLVQRMAEGHRPDVGLSIIITAEVMRRLEQLWIAPPILDIQQALKSSI